MRRRRASHALWLASAAALAACGGDDAATDTGRPDDAATAREIALPDGVASFGMGDLFVAADGTVFHAFTTFNDYSVHFARLDPGGFAET